MRVALFASSYADVRGGVAHHVDRLARGLARRGVEVEITALGDLRLPTVGGNGLTRRIPAEAGRLRSAMASRFWRALRLATDGVDVVDIHISALPLAPPSVPLELGPMILTPHMPMQRLTRWPYSRTAATLINLSHRILCASAAERELLIEAFPQAVQRAEVLRPGVDDPAIQAAAPFASAQPVVVTGGRLERKQCVDRAIAAMASLQPYFRLVILGDGPDRRRLEAFAADLRVGTGVTFAGTLSDASRYRWLRTAHVFAALAVEDSSGVEMMEALTAGASVVASDIPVHREVAEQVPGSRVFFVAPEGSPLDVADAIDFADEAPRPAVPRPIRSWESLVDRTWEVYRDLALDRQRVCAPFSSDRVVVHENGASPHTGAMP
jgi:glycosyltransferase involved in cell wall biosynthesis